ncbi:MAG: hypothetical protein NTU44_15950 [Bacteroidetes bacterium]|nr:hypothetical protein [Bacteroidota bacterium]
MHYYENLRWPAPDGIIMVSYDAAGSGNNTIIDGGANGSVLTISSQGTNITNQTIINGFDLVNGLATNGGGIYMDGDVAPVLVNLNVKEDTAIGNGGGIYYKPNVFYTTGYCNYWKPNFLPCRLINVIVKNNFAGDPTIPAGSGGGIYIEGYYQTDDQHCTEINTQNYMMTLEDCNIRNNKCLIYGGGIFVQYAKIGIDDTPIFENTGATEVAGFILTCQ